MNDTEVLHWPIPGQAGTAWRARPFGQTLDDLDVDLRRAAPYATTAVLTGCLAGPQGRPDEAEVWSWTVNRRLQGLLAVTVATRGERWVFSPTCGQKACGQPMDLPLRFGDFRRSEDPLGVLCTPEEGWALRVRVPTGEDQRSWLHGTIAGDADMLPRLLEGENERWPDSLPDAWLTAIENALSEADPLTALEIETACPECGAGNRIPLDLEQACLGLLAAEQPRLLDDIHRLALAYHWTEAQILAVPRTRRREYLARLQEVWR